MLRKIEDGMTTYRDGYKVRVIIAVSFLTGIMLGSVVTYLLVS